MKIVKHKDTDYEIYTVSEWQEKGNPIPEPFSANSKDSKYVLSEDGFVIAVFGCNQLNKWQFTLKTPYGIVKWRGGKVHTDEWLNGFEKYGEGKEYLTDKQRKFAQIYSATNDRIKAVMIAYDEKNRDRARKKASRLLNIEKVRKYVDKLTQQALDDLGIDHLWILEKLKNVIEDDDKDRVSALKEMIEIANLKSKTKISATASIPLPPSVIKQITGETEPKAFASYEVTDGADSGTEDETPGEDVS